MPERARRSALRRSYLVEWSGTLCRMTFSEVSLLAAEGMVVRDLQHAGTYRSVIRWSAEFPDAYAAYDSAYTRRRTASAAGIRAAQQGLMNARTAA